LEEFIYNSFNELFVMLGQDTLIVGSWESFKRRLLACLPAWFSSSHIQRIKTDGRYGWT